MPSTGPAGGGVRRADVTAGAVERRTVDAGRTLLRPERAVLDGGRPPSECAVPMSMRRAYAALRATDPWRTRVRDD